MERSITGTRTPIVSGGEILGHWDKPDNNLLRFLLRQRMPQRYGPNAPGQQGESDDAVRRAAQAEAMAAARAYINSKMRMQVGELTHLLDHMVENKICGQPYITGIDLTKTIRENAEILRAKAVNAPTPQRTPAQQALRNRIDGVISQPDARPAP